MSNDYCELCGNGIDYDDETDKDDHLKEIHHDQLVADDIRLCEECHPNITNSYSGGDLGYIFNSGIVWSSPDGNVTVSVGRSIDGDDSIRVVDNVKMEEALVIRAEAKLQMYIDRAISYAEGYHKGSYQ